MFCLKVLPAEDRARPHRTVSTLGVAPPPSAGGSSQTRDHLFKACPEWKMQQKILWAEELKETKRWKSRWMVRDLLADGRCGQTVLDFLTSTDVGRLVPPLKEEGDAGSEVSQGELRERREQEEELEVEAEELGAAGEKLGAGEELPLFLPTPPFMASANEE